MESSMNCMEPARGKTPRTRTRTKSLSSPYSETHLLSSPLSVNETERESTVRVFQTLENFPPGKHSRNLPFGRLGLPKTHQIRSVFLSVIHPSPASHIASGMAEASAY